MDKPNIVINELVIETNIGRALDAFMVKAVEGFGLDGEITPERAAEALALDCHLTPDEIRAALEAAFDAGLPGRSSDSP